MFFLVGFFCMASGLNILNSPQPVLLRANLGRIVFCDKRIGGNRFRVDPGPDLGQLLRTDAELQGFKVITVLGMPLVSGQKTGYTEDEIGLLLAGVWSNRVGVVLW